ncbi:MAG: molybdopterin-dependent oxidoreductase, partial [Candidatus Limnocylindria bacterium]
MSSAALDRLLALVLAAQITTGLISLRSGVPATAPLFWIHGLLGGALLVAVVMKLWRSVGPAIRHRRWGRFALGSLLAVLAGGALVGGVAWVASGRILSIGPWTVLTVHVLFALALVPIAALHLLPRRWRLLRPPAGAHLSRRAFLAAASVTALGAAVWGAANLLDAVQGGVRRFTGSRWLPLGGIPPATTFFGEATAPIDTATWRLHVDGRVARPLALSLAELEALGTTQRREILDCTSGWALETDWRGVALGALLDAAGPMRGARVVTVRAVTGWYAT